MKSFSLLFLIIILMCGCIDSDAARSFVVPKFKVSGTVVNLEIQKILKTQDVHIEEISLADNGNIVQGVGIQLINLEENISNDSVINIQKRIASKLNSFLVNPSAYKAYGVTFIALDTVKTLNGILIRDKGYSNNQFSSKNL